MPSPLNVIILCPDELRGDCVGALGNAEIRTPAIDRFAARSVVFARHFATFPKCVPSRISLMTGRYPHTDGYRDTFHRLRADQPDLLSVLRNRGYETAVFGKNHCWTDFSGLVQHASQQPRYREIGRRHLESRPTDPTPRVPVPSLEAGFEYLGCDRTHSVRDEALTEQALAFLRRERDTTRPFFLQLNLNLPHPYYAIEEPWYSLYDRERICPWPHALPEGAPLVLTKQREVRTGLDASEEVLREIQAVYYGMVSKADHLIGRVLEEVESQGLFENSIVLVWSDHGDYAGQYGLVEKWDTSFSDCLIRVPCLLAAPGLPGGSIVTSLSDHTDILPTLLELLDLPPLPGMHGHSLLRAVSGTPERPAVYACGGHEDEMIRRYDHSRCYDVPWGRRDRRAGKQEVYALHPDTMARAYMVRTQSHKLVVRLRGGNELYHLDQDPWELRNLWGHNGYERTMLELQLLLLNWSLRTDSDLPYQETPRA